MLQIFDNREDDKTRLFEIEALDIVEYDNELYLVTEEVDEEENVLVVHLSKGEIVALPNNILVKELDVVLEINPI